jgi:hypothetical protein
MTQQYRCCPRTRQSQETEKEETEKLPLIKLHFSPRKQLYLDVAVACLLPQDVTASREGRITESFTSQSPAPRKAECRR